jgi:hypothetical protein
MKTSTKTRMFAIGTVLAIAAPLALASAQGADPVIGTWALNVAKSTYSAGGAPKSQTRTYTTAGKGYKFIAKGIDADGKATTVEFTTAADGKSVPVTGSPAYDAIVVKRVGANTTESTLMKAGKVVSQNTRTVSKDGKKMTSTAKGTNAAGKAYTNVEVYEKK